MTGASKKARRRLIAAIAAVCVLALAAALAVYAGSSYKADETAAAAMACAQTGPDFAVFGSDRASVGLIFYPGGKVDYDAYAPLAERLAEGGLLCVVARMPLDLAVLDSGAAADIMERYPDVDRWIIGGHSLGAAMAADR